MSKTIYGEIKRRLTWLEAEIKVLKTLNGMSSHARSFVAGKVFAYTEEKHALHNLLELTIDLLKEDVLRTK